MSIARPKCPCCGHSQRIVAYCTSQACHYYRRPIRHRHCKQQCVCTDKGCQG